MNPDFLQLSKYENIIFDTFAELVKQKSPGATKDTERELEIRIRTIDINTGRSISNLSKEYFHELLSKVNETTKNKKVLEKSLVLKEDKYSNDRLICTINKKLKKEFMTKTTIKSAIIDRLGLKISLADEIPKEIPKDVRYNNIIYRVRTSIEANNYWRYDFTCVYEYTDNSTRDCESLKEWYTTVTSNPENVSRYSVEIEYIGKGLVSNKKIIDSLLDSLNKLEINSIVNKYSDICFKNDVYLEVKRCIKDKFALIEPYDMQFSRIISQVISLDHRRLPNIQRYPYMMSEKVDGERHILYISPNGTFNLLNSRNDCIVLCKDKKIALKVAPCILDCELTNVWKKENISLQDIIDHIRNTLDKGQGTFELITKKESTKMLFILDPLVYKGRNMTQCKFLDRCNTLKTIENDIKDCIECLCDWIFKTKNYFSYTKDNVRKLLNTKHNYLTDGIIFAPRNLDYYSKLMLKWKPSELSTIDFLSRIVNDNDKDEIDVYLYVGIRRDLFNKYGLRHASNFNELFGDKYEHADYFPIEFQPRGSYSVYKTTLKYTDRVKVPKKIVKSDKVSTIIKYQYKLKLGEETVEDNQIWEMLYDTNNRNWAVLRVRKDKTERYYQGKGIGNNWNTAISVWSTILRPLKLMGGVVVPEIGGKYFKKEYTKKRIVTKIDNLRRFHNFIKRDLYIKYAKDANYTIELGGGRANDLYKWGLTNIKHVVLIDIDKDNLIEAEKRLKEYKDRSNKKIKLTLIEGNLQTQRIHTLIKDYFFNTKINGLFDNIIANFSMSHVLKNVSVMKRWINESYQLLKINGYLIITSLDGKKVFDGFIERKLEPGDKWNIGDGSVVLTRLFKHNKFMKAGQKIKYFVESIGMSHSEYLVNFDEIINIATEKSIKGHKFNVVLDKYFSDLYSDYSDNIQLNEYEKEYSFLNRVLVLQKNKPTEIAKKNRKKIVERIKEDN